MRHIKPKPEVHERRCPFCPEHVETEQHFLINCRTFSIHREALQYHANNVLARFEHLNDNLKFIKLASDPKIMKETAKYLKKTFELRDFLLRHHKGLG